jgi:hypothetical protein
MENKEKIYAKAMKVLEENKDIYFIEHLASYLGISRTTTYKLFPLGSDEMNTIKDIINVNVCRRQQAIIGVNWANSDDFKKQIGFLKVTGDTELRKALSTAYIETKETKEVDLSKASDEEIAKLLEAEEIKNKINNTE